MSNCWRVVAIIAIGLGLAGVAYSDWVSRGELPFWQLYLLPVTLAGIVFEVLGGLIVGILASILFGFLSPMAEGLRIESLLGWQLGFFFWGGLVGYLKWQARSLREINERLRQQQELREAMTDFLIHDLRSPLTNIITGLETLLVTSENQLSSDCRELLDVAMVGAHRLLTMVNSLLDLRKLEEGKFPLYIQEFEPQGAVKEAVRQVRLWAKQSGITVQTDIAEPLPKLVGDRWVVVRILVNLLSNAVKYTPIGKTVTVRVLREDSWLHFSVTDEGPGIPKEYLDHIFDRFVQVEARKSGAAIGTGLGLTFCKLAVEAHGGRIWLESDMGKGTTAHFIVPLKVSQVVTPTPAKTKA